MPRYHFEIGGGDDEPLLFSAAVEAFDPESAATLLRELIARPQGLNPAGNDATTHQVFGSLSGAGNFANLHIAFRNITVDHITGVDATNDRGHTYVEDFSVRPPPPAPDPINVDEIAALRLERRVALGLPPDTIVPGEPRPLEQLVVSLRDAGISPENLLADVNALQQLADSPRRRPLSDRERHERSDRVRQRRFVVTRGTAIEHLPALRINCPELFARDDFRRWLNAGFRQRAPSGPQANYFQPVATWHRGGEPHGNSDVFMFYDHGELSDGVSDEVDAIIIEHWHRNMDARNLDYGIIWLVNTE